MNLAPDPKTFLSDAKSKAGVGVIQVDRSILVDSALLVNAHRDPADRILIATALKHNMKIATADQKIVDFARHHRQLSVLDVTTH